MPRPATAAKFRRMLLLFLRGHYASAANYVGFDHLGCYVWHPDKKTSTLSVDYSHLGDDNNPDSYPGIFIGFPSVQYARLGLSQNRAGHSQDRAGTYVSKAAEANFTITHVAAKANDAYDLAEMSAAVLQAMGYPLMARSGADGFEILAVEPPKEKKPSPESYYAVAMRLQISYTHTVTRNIESHRIRRIILQTDTEN